MSFRLNVALAAVLLSPLAASAHFPFLHLTKEADRPTLNVYFAESPEPDDPSLLDRLVDSKVWQLQTDGAPQTLKLIKRQDSLVAEPSGSKPAAYGLIKDYGVISRGDSTFKLAYYAKTFSGADAWSVDTSKQLALNIVPVRKGDDVEFQVTWKGEPLPEAEIVVQGGIESIEGKTDAQGRFTCSLPDPDLYAARVKHVEDAAGEIDGKKFESTRHYSTLTFELK